MSQPARCALRQATDLSKDCGGTMSVKRSIIAPAILMLSTAGSIAAGTVATVATTSAPAAAVASAPQAQPAFLYRG